MASGEAGGWIQVAGVVIAGYGVASGQGQDSPYPQGSITMQTPFFQAQGLDLSPYFAGTLNISIAPHRFTLTQPQYTFRQVTWFDDIPPEDFSFSACRIALVEAPELAHKPYRGWVYYPHPDTKPNHFQDPSVVEVIAEPVPNITYGSAVQLWLKSNEVEIEINPDGTETK